jgi:succinate dehydrogenase/fumarate reductase flavoprotein subunit
VPRLYAAGEIAGGANGANRLSGNALPEALVFGERAGAAAARLAGRQSSDIAITMDSDESSDYISDQGLCYGQVIHQ